MLKLTIFIQLQFMKKGAEVIRMIHTPIGEQGFQKGMKKYFELFDGKAVTTGYSYRP